MTGAVATFLVTLIGILGVYWLFVVRPEQHASDALWKRLRAKRPAQARATAALLKKGKQLSAVPAFNSALNSAQAATRPIETLIEQSGSKLTVGAFLLMSAFGAFVVFLVAYRVTRLFPLAAVLAALVAPLPMAILRYKRSKRLFKFEEQFPEALDLISRALKAGHSFTTGLAMVADEMPAPIGPEFRLLYDQQNFGMPMPDAMREFARRIPLLDARFFVTAVLIQRDAGGNLSEVLDNLAGVIRDRFRVKRQIRVISAHGRLTGAVLTAIPPCLALVLFLINPDHWKTLSGTPLGVRMMIAALVLQILGGLTVRKLIRIEY